MTLNIPTISLSSPHLWWNSCQCFSVRNLRCSIENFPNYYIKSKKFLFSVCFWFHKLLLWVYNWIYLFHFWVYFLNYSSLINEWCLERAPNLAFCWLLFVCFKFSCLIDGMQFRPFDPFSYFSQCCFSAITFLWYEFIA